MQLYESLVTPEEAVEIYGQTTVVAAMRAMDIADAYRRRDPFDRSASGVLGCVWNAGRIQGIREERRRRKDAELCKQFHQKPIEHIETDSGSVPCFGMRYFINTLEGSHLHAAWREAEEKYQKAKAEWEANGRKFD